tara:strand:- start:618 stop:1433 length:816 start_codon:yes stop_codon:yes gene_type:complete
LVLRNINFFSKNKLHVDLKFKGESTVKIPNTNYRFKLNCWESTIENEIFWNGLGQTWEPETVNLWIDLCKKSKVIFDIGANTGIYSLIAKSINKDNEVIAFEPSDLVLHKLKKNIYDNNFDIKIVEKGVSNLTGDRIFYDVDDLHQTSASLSPDKLKNFDSFKGQIREYKISTIRLDKFIEENNIIPDLIKIDVELHEPEVIEGLGKYLNKIKPTIIIEVLTAKIAETLNKSFDNSIFDIYRLKKNQKPQIVNEIIPNECYNYLIKAKSII